MILPHFRVFFGKSQRIRSVMRYCVILFIQSVTLQTSPSGVVIPGLTGSGTLCSTSAEADNSSESQRKCYARTDTPSTGLTLAG